ncbi:MAG TPA: DUF3592 domain-containing protein [Tepidisphaeraceae bacterium]|jgi:hypothetical protein
MIVAAGQLPGWAVWAIPLTFVVVCTLLLKGIECVWPRHWRVPRRSERSGSTAIIVFGGVFVLIGVVAFFFTAVRPTYRAYQAKRWPTTNGVVLQSRLKWDSHTRSPTAYRPDIRYGYTVDGRAFESSAYDVGGGFVSSRFNRIVFGVVDAHPPGQPVTVYYDPDDPADAVLVTDRPGPLWVSFLFLLGFGGVGGFLIWVTIRNLKSTPQERD